MSDSARQSWQTNAYFPAFGSAQRLIRAMVYVWILAFLLALACGWACMLAIQMRRLRHNHCQLESQLERYAHEKSRLLAALNGSPDAVIGMQQDGAIVFWNPAAERMFGLLQQEALGLKARGLLTALAGTGRAQDDLEKIRDAFVFDAQTGSKHIAEIQLPRKGGDDVTVEILVEHNGADSQWAFTTYVRDIAAHLQARNALEAAKRQLLDVTDNLPVAVYQFRMANGKSFFPFANLYWNNMGLPPELVMSDPSQVFVLNHPDDWEGVRHSIHEAVTHGTVWRKEMRIRFPDGNYRWMLGCSKPIPHPEGGVIFSGYWQDIHESKMQALAVEEAQVAAETARQQLVDMTYGLPLTVFQFWCNHAGRMEFLFVGGNSEGLIGVPTSEILRDADQWWRSAIKEDRALLQSALHNAMQTQQACSVEHRILRDGAVRWIRTQALPTQLASGIWVWNGFWMDETDARSHMDEMRRAMQMAEEATRTKSTFLATMSHEIRTPMNAIIGMSHLAMGYPMDAKARNFVEKVHRAGTNLLGIINDILDFSKIEANKMELEQVDFYLGDVLDNVRNLLGMKAEEKGLELRFHVPSSLPARFIGDPLRLGQILVNLGNNAIKFTERGAIDVGVRQVASQQTGVELEFSVHDSGIGMNAEQCSRLFQAFSQADGSTTRKFGGTGLGLAISKRLVELMGGHISVESTPGLGSTFTFRVLLNLSSEFLGTQDTDPHMHRTQSSDAHNTDVAAVGLGGFSLQGLRLLLVEDNEMNQELATELLQGAGAQVTVANHGAHALDILASNAPFDAVLMDCQMPVMDGYSATRQLRLNPAWADLPVIAMTANVMAGELEQCRAAGMNAHIAKPLNVTDMFATIARWVRPAAGLAVPMPEVSPSDLAGAHSALPARLPGIDIREGLAHTGNNEPLYVRQLQSFLRNHADFCACFDAAVQAQDLEAATRLAHTLKGTAGSIGALAVQEACAHLERNCLEGASATDLHAQCASVGILLETVLEALRAMPSAPHEAGPVQGRDDLDLQALLSQLGRLCLDSDTDAVELGSTVLQVCKGTPREALARKLDRAVQEFDFDAALEHVRALQQALQPA